ncbi:hypothetical protein JTE90_008550 [Oedothorax gibbosus]|uniref:RRM domain-containing protein n=1 Tax=Oedothorax gibbosus TaxID=931172 RepID=A0AAV6VJJ2_9ARAC|nr:hypothetical protein JTE90_008550 [Oedothorax gibbosus]
MSDFVNKTASEDSGPPVIETTNRHCIQEDDSLPLDNSSNEDAFENGVLGGYRCFSDSPKTGISKLDLNRESETSVESSALECEKGQEMCSVSKKTTMSLPGVTYGLADKIENGWFSKSFSETDSGFSTTGERSVSESSYGSSSPELSEKYSANNFKHLQNRECSTSTEFRYTFDGGNIQDLSQENDQESLTNVKLASVIQMNGQQPLNKINFGKANALSSNFLENRQSHNEHDEVKVVKVNNQAYQAKRVRFKVEDTNTQTSKQVGDVNLTSHFVNNLPKPQLPSLENVKTCAGKINNQEFPVTFPSLYPANTASQYSNMWNQHQFVSQYSNMWNQHQFVSQYNNNASSNVIPVSQNSNNLVQHQYTSRYNSNMTSYPSANPVSQYSSNLAQRQNASLYGNNMAGLISSNPASQYSQHSQYSNSMSLNPTSQYSTKMPKNSVIVRPLMPYTVQENGQRIYGGPPPGWVGPPPPKGCEVFINDLPRHMFEDELVPLFQSIGVLYEFRLVINHSGHTSRGYAFAKYSNQTDAQLAIDCLHTYEISPGRFILVELSVDNLKLHIKGVPCHMTTTQVYEEMCRITPGVARVYLYPNLADPSRNRGFTFVEYENHHAADIARRILYSPGTLLFGKIVPDNFVNWAKLEPEVDEECLRAVTSLYARNIPLHVGEWELKKIFSLNGKFVVQKVRKIKNFAFVHFFTREEAENALQHFNEFILDGSVLEVMWAKPRIQKITPSDITETKDPLLHRLANGMPSYQSVFNNPTLFLQCVCEQYRFGEPVYRVSRKDAPDGSVEFKAEVSISNWPLPVKKFVGSEGFPTAIEAKRKVAISALKSFEFYCKASDYFQIPMKFQGPMSSAPICQRENNQMYPDITQIEPTQPNGHLDASSLRNSSNSDSVNDLDLLPVAVALARNMFIN